VEICSAKARGLTLESTIGAGQNSKLVIVSEVSELRCAYVLRLAGVPIFCSHPVLSGLI
jgi:hypothetical protein